MDEEELKRLIDEYEASTGERSPLRDIVYPPGAQVTAEGFPFYSPETPPPTQTVAPTPEAPEEALQKLAPTPEEDLQALAPPATVPPPPAQEPAPDPLEGLPDPFYQAATRQAHAVQPPGGRTEGALTQAVTEGPSQVLDMLNELARGVTEESVKATAGEEFDPSVPLAAAQLAVNPSAAFAIGAAERGIPAVARAASTPPMPLALAQYLLTPSEAEAAPESVVRLPPKGLTPEAERIIMTVGGPNAVNQSDLTALGIIGATTFGMAFAPTVFRNLHLNLTPRLRAVKNAMPGTVAISTPTDLARTYDDVTAGAIRLARRAGVDPSTAAQLEETFRIQSRMGARALTDSAVQTGNMETPAFRFRAPVALMDLQAQMTPQAQQYLLLRDTMDQLHVMSQMKRYQPSATATVGVPIVGGQDLTDVARAIGALERANPEVRDISKAYNAHVRAVRKFQSEGEYATIPKGPPEDQRSVAYLNSQRPNEVPFRGERSVGMDLAERENPISSQAYATRLALRERLENEAVGKYVDTVRKANPQLFTRISPEDLADNPQMRKNVVSFYRRGEKEMYTTDPFLADVLKMDPYYVTGMLGNAMFASKRLLEFGATGMGAPAFAPISLLRSWQIAKYTTEKGFRSPTLLGSLSAIPKQLYPQMARAFSRSLENGSGRWLSSVVGQRNVDALAQRLAYEFDHSLYAQLQTVGSAKGSILEQQIMSRTTSAANRAFEKAPEAAKQFWHAWRSTWEAVHNGPAFDFVAKNLRAEPLPQLASRARSLTGDPRRGGQYYTYGPGGREHAIRFESDSRVTHTAAKTLQYAYGVPMELMRDSVPWFNATLQGAKRIGQAYMHDPVMFTRNAWLYAMAPAASLYFYARSLGKDPNGVDYVDYMLNRRSSYNRQMNWYIPIPGRPAEDGVELPFFHELAPFKRAMEIALDHSFRSNDVGFPNTNKQDFWNAAHAFLDTAVIPPMPPTASVLFASQGMAAPQGVFGGEAYKRKDDPFDQTGGMPSSVELYTRALGGGIGDSLAQAYAAYSQTPEGFFAGLSNAAKAAARVQIRRAPIIRDVTGIKAPLTGNTDQSRELFEKQKEIDTLAKFYQKWDKEGKYTQPGEINVEPKSKGGGLVADYLLGPKLSQESPGIDQPNPTNPLYLRFAEEVYNRFRKESPLAKGKEPGQGLGFGSLWRRYGDATAKLERMKNINEGNYVTWQNEINDRPGALKELQDNGVDTTNLRQVKNFYETKRFDAARTILYMIRAVEADMSRQLGQPITLKDLDPYAKPPPMPMTQMPLGFPSP